MASVILAGTTSTTALNLTGDTSGELQLKTNNGSTTAMTLTTAGNVGIGTSSPSAKLDLGTTVSKDVLLVYGGGSGSQYGLGISGGILELYTSASGQITFNQRNGASYTERMRIDTSGGVGIGTSSPSSFGKFVVDDGSKNARFLSSDANILCQVYGAVTKGHYRATYPSVADWDMLAGSSGQFAFLYNDTERMRIDSSGSLRINNTGSGGTGPLGAGKFTMTSDGYTMFMGGRFVGADNSSTYFTFGNFGDTSSETRISTRGFTAFRTGATSEADGTERMRVTSSGDIGIGTTTPRSKLTLKADTSAATVEATPSIVLSNRSQTNSTFFAGGIFADFYRDATDPTYAGGIWFERVPTSANLSSNANIIFGVMANGSSSLPSERMRITVDGALLVGTSTTLSSTDAVHKFGDTGTNTAYARLMMQERTGNWISFCDGGSTHYGTISRSGGGVSYGSNSDYRLKENIAPMTGALAKVQQLKPCTYTWKETGKQGDGFIAHELQEVCPDAVVGEKDAINPESDTPMYQQVDTSYLVATLTAAIQEQQAIITDLKQRIETLEAK